MSEEHALLQTDIIGSTALTEHLGDAAMSALWSAHDRLSRDLLGRWRGREIDKSDGFLLIFDRTSDAVGYALDYHRALDGLRAPLKARAGIHHGPVTIRANPREDVERGAKPLELEGLAKPVAARVMSLATGGQTLLTEQARSTLGSTMLRLMSHGHWRLKGLDEPIELFEAGSDAAPFEPPPDTDKVYRVVRHGELWLPVRELRHSLPAERDPFVGRQALLQTLGQKFDAGTRLISVLGTAGMGKTRLAQRFGWTRLGDFPGGVWFCDLSQATSLDSILHAVAEGLALSLAGADPVEQIGRALAGRAKCLLILDNFEQVVRHAESTLGRWLDSAAEALFIVTTREVLGIAGEDTLALAPLAPTEAAGLFMKRAAAARYGFDPNAEDRAAIEPLVRLLDGLPLAIELAAARVPVMPPRMLLQRMSERFKLLSARNARGGRQATLRGAFDWSWDLLSQPDKTALAQLSAFEGGFDMLAVEAVLDLSACDDAPWPIDALQSLVHKSLVRQVSDHRFDLLGTVHDYAAEQLSTEGRFPGSGPAASAAALARHWRYFAGLDERAAVADGCVEIDNLASACSRAASEGDCRAASGALVGAWFVLRLRGPFSAAIELAAKVRAMAGLDAGELALADWVAGCALQLVGRVAEARVCLETGLTHARVAGWPVAEARLLCALSDSLSAAGLIDEALAHLQRALALARDAGDRALQCSVLNGLGAWFDEQARLEDARNHYEAALHLARELADLRMEGGALGNLGGLHLVQGRLGEARDSYEQALQLALKAGDRRWEGNGRCNLGLIDHEQGRPAGARSQFEAALAIARETGHAHLEATVQCNLGIVTESAGEAELARAHYERAVTVAQELADRRSEGQFRGYLGRLYARQGHFEAARACLAAGETLLAAIPDAFSLALLRCSQAEAAHLAGDSVAAQRALALAVSGGEEADAGVDSELARALRQVRTLLAA
jgi:predicted ATPase/class 3 adenylate cyclase/Tfp pilus assembly protein PilF